jgi:hypothetical protein
MGVRILIEVDHYEWDEADVEPNLEAIFDPQESALRSIIVTPLDGDGEPVPKTV